MQSKQPSVTVPQYTPPSPTGFNTPYGSVGYSGSVGSNGFYNGSYNYTSADPSGDLELQTMRDALTASLTPTGPGALQQTQDWQTAFTQSALKNAAPQLSNQLFNAGLGGSAAYGNALGDLYSNTSTQAVLNAQNMSNSALQTNANSLNSVNTAYGQNQNYALNLQQLANTYNTNANQQYLQKYQSLLPYQATVNNNQGSGYGQIIGAVGGGIAGAFMGNPILGAQVGSSLGGGVDSAMGNTSVGGPLITSSLGGLSALQGAGFFGSSPLTNVSTNSGYGMTSSPYSPNNGGGTNNVYGIFQ
jgi:hypothetical protein